jgi:hypothetical protein
MSLDFDAAALEACFDAFGVAVTYHAPDLDGEFSWEFGPDFHHAGGQVLPAIVTRPDYQQSYGDTAIVTGTRIFDVRASQLAAPVEGARIVQGGVAYVVQGVPFRPDPDGLLWRLNSYPM